MKSQIKFALIAPVLAAVLTACGTDSSGSSEEAPKTPVNNGVGPAPVDSENKGTAPVVRDCQYFYGIFDRDNDGLKVIEQAFNVCGQTAEYTSAEMPELADADKDSDDKTFAVAFVETSIVVSPTGAILTRDSKKASFSGSISSIITYSNLTCATLADESGVECLDDETMKVSAIKGFEGAVKLSSGVKVCALMKDATVSCLDMASNEAVEIAGASNVKKVSGGVFMLNNGEVYKVDSNFGSTKLVDDLGNAIIAQDISGKSGVLMFINLDNVLRKQISSGEAPTNILKDGSPITATKLENSFAKVADGYAVLVAAAYSKTVSFDASAKTWMTADDIYTLSADGSKVVGINGASIAIK